MDGKRLEWLQSLKAGDVVRVYAKAPHFFESGAEPIAHATPKRYVVLKDGRKFSRRNGHILGASGYYRCWIEPEQPAEQEAKSGSV